MTIHSIECSKCHREAASSDELDFAFRIAGWKWDREKHEWTCDECVDKENEAKEADHAQNS